jgi:putative peptidoglycan lipid II flippase
VLVLVALIAIGAVVAYLVLRGGSSPSGKTTSTVGGSPVGATVTLSGVTAYDPRSDGGDDNEHDSAAGLATDGSTSTFWDTEHYRDAPALGGKPGVGLVLDAGRSVQLHNLGFSTGTPGFTAEIKAGSSKTGPFDAVVGASQVVGAKARYTITGGPYRYYLIWITKLGSADSAQINVVSAN